MSSRLRPQRLANLATAAGGITLDSTFGTLRSALGLFSRVRVSAARVRAGRTGVLPKRSARFKVGGAVCCAPTEAGETSAFWLRSGTHGAQRGASPTASPFGQHSRTMRRDNEESSPPPESHQSRRRPGSGLDRPDNAAGSGGPVPPLGYRSI